jgi:flavin-dependent dehydrogenase
MVTAFDVIAVGSGPSGSVFAYELSKIRPDLKILLIDGQSEERRKVCGGLLAPDAQKAFAQMDITLPKSVLADPQIFAVDTFDLSSEKRRCYQRHYLNMDRYAFDKFLLDRVPDTVTVIKGRCTEVLAENNGYFISVRTSDGVCEYKCAFLVGADGAGSVVRRCLYGKLPYQYVSIQEWYACDGQGMPSYSCIFDPMTSDSCSWTVRKDGHTVFGGAFKKQGSREAFAKQKSRLEDYLGVKFGDPIRTEACLISSPRRFSDLVCGKNGAFLVGEAAGFISSSSFEGISYAILSGKTLAHCFEGLADERKVAKRYRARTFKMRLKLLSKMLKRGILCSPFLRGIILKTGIKSIK